MLRARLSRGFDQGTLRTVLLLFFLALAMPTASLVYQAYTQLKWEAFHQHRLMAEELAQRVNARLVGLVRSEEAYSFADYSFLVLAGDPNANFLQRSPLSAYPVDRPIPGLLAYFQVDAAGGFSTPLLPQQASEPGSYGISATEYAQRLELQQQVQQVLSLNHLVTGRPAATAVRDDADAFGDVAVAEEESLGRARQDAPVQAAFDNLKQPYAAREQLEGKRENANTYRRVEDLQLDSRLAAQSLELAQSERKSSARLASAPEERAKRKELISLPEPTLLEMDTPADKKDAPARLRVTTFESEIDPFDFSLLDSGHFVLYRTVWRDGQRFIQGAIIEQQAFLQGVMASAFAGTALSSMSDLIVAYGGNVVTAVRGQAGRDHLGSADYLQSSEELSGALLYRSRLSAPLADLELIFSVTRLPAGPGGTLLGWISLVLLIVLCGGFYLIYRLGLSQLKLTRQQQDFVSAVSHELKTPLTSIRMYGEMLRAGWAEEDKKQGYYDFIYDESERLSRLITNVLQLAQLTRNKPHFDLKPFAVAELLNMVESKVSGQVKRAGFTLHLDPECDPEPAYVSVDTDSFTQVIINLVDNAIKFSCHAEEKIIEISCQKKAGEAVLFSVRDYGPGIPAGQLKKIFTLFYRSESELTRETVGTGIGLALVHQLVIAMGGKVDVCNRDPGAEFRVSFPVVEKPG